MRESASPTGVSTGLEFTTPISSSDVRFGACVRLARTDATCGSPRPTTTISPSCNSLAPATAMISVVRIGSKYLPIDAEPLLIPEDRVGPQRFEPARAAGLFQVFGE